MAKKISGNPSKVSSKSRCLLPKRRGSLQQRLTSVVQMAFIFLIALVVVIFDCRPTGLRPEEWSIAALTLSIGDILRVMATHLFPSQRNGG